MPNFTYTRDIPDAPHNPSNDQGPMKVNTNSSDSIFAVDHFSFNDNKGGSHKQVTLTNEAAPGLGDGNGVLYANLITGNSWPIWQNALGSTIMLGGPTTALANGTVYLAGNIIIQWGFVNGSHAGFFQGGDTGTVTFVTSNINFPTNCFTVWTQACFVNPPPGSQATVSPRTASISTAGFDWAFVTNSSAYNKFFWMAIGN